MLVLGFWNQWFLVGTVLGLLPVIAWNHELYRFYYAHGGTWFCVRAMAMHWLYYVYSTLAFAFGCLKYFASRHKP